MALSRITNPFLSSSGAGNASITSPAANTVAFTTATTERMRIDSSGKVGIGTTSPSAPLHVQAITGGLAMRFTGRASPADGYSDIGFFNNANTTQFAGFGVSNAGVYLSAETAIPIIFYTSATERMRIDSSGRVTTPYQPAFMAVVGTEVAVTGGAENLLTTAFTGTTYNVGSHFNTANGRFTAPVAGVYHFVADFYVYSVSSVEIYFKINGSTYIRTWDKGTSGNLNPSGNHRSYQVYLSASDYVTLSIVPNVTAALWNGGPYSSRFTGCLLG